jgi:hypothetical protein
MQNVGIKKRPVKGVRQVFIRVYRLKIYSVILVFSTQLCELLLSNLLSCLTLPTLPPPCMLETTTLYQTRFRTYKIATQPQTKILEVGGIGLTPYLAPTASV